jgi:2-keto-4-pentenoate hydratase/2-oxohepta-3-ene-1,7-dioic acid hydratase in catechol pathway
MKVARVRFEGESHYAMVLEDGQIELLDGAPFTQIRRTGRVVPGASIRYLCPVEAPRIIGVAYNYRAHTAESGKEQPVLPVLFMKPDTAAIGTDEPILLPPDSEIVHFEAELVAIIGTGGRRIPADTALDHVFGYTCGNDISDRVIQRQESRFGCLLAGKGFDTFAPLGPVIETDFDPRDAQISLRQNGILRQSASTRDLVHSLAEIVAYLSGFMTLKPGDVIMTGTPAGVGEIAPGDRLDVEIPGIGILSNPVVAEA